LNRNSAIALMRRHFPVEHDLQRTLAGMMFGGIVGRSLIQIVALQAAA
jgi:hypothetical protein